MLDSIYGLCMPNDSRVAVAYSGHPDNDVTIWNLENDFLIQTIPKVQNYGIERNFLIIN